jgi:acyl transferase domain-containing protein/SAM-dependent methyltransferase
MTDSVDNLSPMKRAILEIRDLRARLDAIEQARTEPIAIVGLGLRLPGGAHDAESFWRVLRDGVDAITEVPPDRWDIDAYYDADSTAPGKMTTRYGAFLSDIDRFDAAFFGIAPREAVSMDPQQRLLLEVAWEALENAGQAPEKLAESDTGVFLGIANSDYFRMLLADPMQIDTYVSTGNAFSVAAGRLSYLLGLHGPNLALDTACSSSLVAVHLACQSLRRGECHLALAGGVNLILTPEVNINFSQAQMMSPDGRCKTFDARADGYVRGEGCALIVLKRLADAVANQDQVLAIIRGTAINHDGRSGGLTAPNGPAQEAVIRAALADAGLAPSQVSYVETHGTGTSLGDPIEVRALGAVYGGERDPQSPLMIASVKTNIGHLEAVAGVAGLIKTVLMLQHREIPPHLHFEQPSPYIEWDRWPIVVPTQHATWQAAQRVAGVSSFGLSGTNAHVIVEEAPHVEHRPIDLARPMKVLTLSAKSTAALKASAAQFEQHLREHTPTLAEVCFTANTGRSHFAHRLAVIASTADEARERLTAFVAERDNVNVFSGHRLDVDPPDIAFLFTGYGSQYADMGRSLYDTQPAFRAAIDRCDEIFKSQTGESLKELLYSQSTTTQPAVFALEYALAELWKSWGVEPAIVLGHSLGEYAAACVAGVFSLADGLKLAAARDRLMQSVPIAGEMVTVFADESTVAEVLRSQPEVAIAAINSPESVVISGRREAVEAVIAQLQARKIRSRRLPIGYASHSPLIEPILDEFEQIASEVTYAAPQIAMASSLTGQLIDGAEIAQASYWRRHLRSTVRFAAAIQTLYEQGYRAFVEIGPNPTLVSLGQRCVPDTPATVWLASLREGVDDSQQMFETLATLYVNGAAIDWAGFEPDEAAARTRVSLPTYPFERKSFWWKNERVTRAPQSTSQRWAASVSAALRQARQAPLDLALPTYAEKWRCLDDLSLAYVVRTLRDLGMFTRAADRYTLDELLTQSGIATTYRHLLERWLNKLIARGWLARDGESVRSLQPLPAFDLEATLQAAQRAWSDTPFLLDYVQSCGDKLGAIVTGSESALETLFPGGSFATTENLYQHWAVARYFNNIVGAAVEAIGQATLDRTLRVIEIGAGTGSTSSFVLPLLPTDRSLYHFTDVSDLFLNRARGKFAAFPFVRYGLLDIERDPGEQGYAPHSYDVVIAANVLHATSDLNATLQHVRSLLGRDGILVLFEATTPQSWYDTTTGLIEGWQRFADDLRGDSPLLSPVQWTTLLHANGFVEVVALPGTDSPAAILGQHVIIARAPAMDAALIMVGPIDEAELLATTTPEPEAPAPDEWVQQLRLALPDERTDLLIDFVRGKVARVLRLDPAEPIERRARLMDLGVDSLMAVELRNSLSTGLGLGSRALPATLIFDYPTIEAIAAYVSRDVLALDKPAEAPTPDRATRPAETSSVSAADLAQLSDEAVEAMLLEKLKAMPK